MRSPATRNRPRRAVRHGRSTWLTVLLVGFSFATLLTSACGPIVMNPSSNLRRAQAIVVLGNRPPVDAQGQIRPETLRRVRRGVSLWFQGLAPVMVMTGGPTVRGVVEADVMRDAAVGLGVPADRIRRERRSQSTIDNARETVSMLCRRTHAARSEPCRPSVIVVSSPYHLRRARDLFRCAGARVQVAATPYSNDPAARRHALWHERLVRFAYAFFDPCRRAHPASP